MKKLTTSATRWEAQPTQSRRPWVKAKITAKVIEARQIAQTLTTATLTRPPSRFQTRLMKVSTAISPLKLPSLKAFPTQTSTRRRRRRVPVPQLISMLSIKITALL